MNTIIRLMLIAVFVLSAAPFAKAEVDVNLTGEYWFGSLSADVSTNVPWGKQGTIVINGSNLSQEWDDPDGHHTFSSTFTTDIQPDGSININLSSGVYNVAFNGDVMIHADTTPDADNRLGIDIFARKAANVTAGEVVGSYRLFGHWLGWDDRWDEVGWGNCNINANGTTISTWSSSEGYSETDKSAWTLDSVNATVSLLGVTNPLLVGKGGVSFVSRPAVDSHPDLGYNLFIKKTTKTITPADIAGTYLVRFLETGPGGVPYTCGQGTVIIEANGTYSVDAHYSDGEDDTHNGTFAVGPGNNIKFDGAVNGIISPDKNLIFAPETDRPRNPHDYDWIGGLFFVREPNSAPNLQFGNLSGTKSTKLVVNDACNVLVTFSLTGGGDGEVIGGPNFAQINLYNTTEKTQLTITSKTQTSIGDINSNGPLKGITAKTAELSGSIKIGPSSDPKAAVTIAFGWTNELNIDSNMPIKSIAAMDWEYGSLTAPSIGSITLKASPKLQRYGYMGADINVAGDIGNINIASEVHGTWKCKSIKNVTILGTMGLNLTLTQEPNLKVPALGKLTSKEYFEYSRIISAGNIGTVTFGEFKTSSCFAGVADACLVNVNANDSVLDLPPVLDDTFSQDATIKSFIVKGFKGYSPPNFANSNIAAKNITSISIAYPQYGNSGTPFGISTYNDPAAITIKDADGTHSWKKGHIGDAVEFCNNNGGDMEIRRD